MYYEPIIICELIKCENCGNEWDGCAQCNCWGREMYQRQFDEDNNNEDEEKSSPEQSSLYGPPPQKDLPDPPLSASHRSSPPQKEVPEPPTIKALKKTIDILKSTVSQLIGGLYNNETQKHQLEWRQHFLYENPQLLVGEELHKEIQHILHENRWPTTRQGDEQEKKIQALEKRCEEQAQKFEEQAQKFEEQAQKFEEQAQKIKALEDKITGKKYYV
jgi:hypothetical protein